MTTSNESVLESALSAIACGKNLFDVTIVCTTDDHQASYWMKRLSEGVCLNKDPTSSLYPLVLAVSEDWNSKGGAGNGLGTLYAYQKANRLGKELHNIDLDRLLSSKEISAALYHTAGKGTRLAPLPASENNNKPGVKLPYCHKLENGNYAPITVLEAVVKQTGIYASSRRGRLSVFWGDQVFIPSAPFQYTPSHHIDIMCTLLGTEAPTAEEWAAEGLEKYGVIAVSKGKSKDAAQVEKVDHATAVKMLQVLGDIGSVGPSLGSFSLTAEMISALCEEYKSELTSKCGKFDTDPHFWMPFTLPVNDYATLMKQKGVPEFESKQHHDRMSKMKSSLKLDESLGLFGAVDVGKDAAWWDYGLLKKYASNNSKLKESTPESKLMKQFFGMTSSTMNSTIGNDCNVDDKSCLFSSKVSSGTITNSILASVQSPSVEATDAIIINCAASKIVAPKNCILYNIISDSPDGIVLDKEGEVLVSVTDSSTGNATLLRSNVDTCGGKAWKILLDGNELSFEGMHAKNQDADIVKIDEMRQASYKKVSESFLL